MDVACERHIMSHLTHCDWTWEAEDVGEVVTVNAKPLIYVAMIDLK